MTGQNAPQASALRVESLVRLSRRESVSLFVLALPLLPVLLALNSFAYPGSGAAYSDLAIAHYPYTLFFRHSLFQDHVWPLWYPLLFSGGPLAANPLSGLWYPPGWLALVLPLPFGFNLLTAFHLLAGGLGLYRLLRLDGRSHAAALAGGLAFTALPKFFAHYGAGHLTLLYGFCWTPWLLLAGQRPGRWLRAGPILALIFLADPRAAAYSGAVWAAFTWFEVCQPLRWFVRLARLGRELLLAALLAGPLALPMLELAPRSTRAGLGPADVLAYSLPPARLLGLFFPDFGGFHEWVLYPGAAGLALALLALIWSGGHDARQRSSRRFWGLVLGLSLVWSLGAALPGAAWLARLPGIDLLRVPSRALFLTGLAFAWLAAAGVDDLAGTLGEMDRRRGMLWLVGWAALLLALAGGVAALAGGLLLNFTWGALAAVTAAVWTGLRLRNRIGFRAWVAGLIILCLLDLGWLDRSLFRLQPAAEILAEGQPAAGFLKAESGSFRVYSPSYSLPQQTAAAAGLELASGVDPLQLRAYVEYLNTASGVPAVGYSVPLPPLEGNDPTQANAAYEPDAARLGLLNVRYVLAEFDLDAPGLAQHQRFGETRVYENLMAQPRAWLQPVGEPLGEGARPVEVLHRGANRIVLRIANETRYSLLVLSEIDYPGWQAWVDGAPTPVQAAGGLLRAVGVGPGEHEIVFAYRPWSVVLGLIASLAGLILWLTRWI